jgi:hypothetical protein
MKHKHYLVRGRNKQNSRTETETEQISYKASLVVLIVLYNLEWIIDKYIYSAGLVVLRKSFRQMDTVRLDDS